MLSSCSDGIFLVFISPQDLRARLADRCETWPHDRYLAEFYNASPNIWAALPLKKFGAKNMQNLGQFYTTSDFDREYLRNDNISKIGKTYDRARSVKQVR